MAFGRLGGYFTVKNATALADLAVRVAAVVAAVGVVAYFVLRPDVRLTTHMQPFIDVAALDKIYDTQGGTTPALVRNVAVTYNDRNTSDLETGKNATLHEIPVHELCAANAEVVEAVFAGTDCTNAPPRIGRNRYYERLLVQRAVDTAPLASPEQLAVTTAELQTAITNLQATEYLRARVTIENRGLGKAVKTTIRVSNGFAPLPNVVNDPFVLGPHDTIDRFFETSRGVRGRVLTPSRPGSPAGDPVVQFGVSWDRSPNPLDDLQIQLWLGIIIVTALLAMIVALAVNDIRVSTQAAAANSAVSDAREQPRNPITKRTQFHGPSRD
jgi:hypothetical protein